MSVIAPSELIINHRGAIYHIDCLPEEVADTIITVGDPDRVSEVSKHFDAIEVRNQHREFVTHTGRVGKKRVSVMSTGIGPDNIDIVFNEIDALKNIDLQSRTIKSSLTSVQIIRLGTSGALQKEIGVDEFVAGTHGIGLDNLLNYYSLENNSEEKEILQAFIAHTQIQPAITSPYIASASISLLKHFVDGFHQGITVTCPGFYGPQGRVLRLGLRHPSLIDLLPTFRFGNHFISNFEMETSAMYGMCNLLGHQVVSLNAIVANRVQKTFSENGKAAVENLIKKALPIIENI